jgi:aryl-alcohol dehydrogenase-like predicted oxidoreductase
MDKRQLGKTGEMLSTLGFGGIMVMNETPSFASRLVAQAVDRGVSYFDVAPAYGDAEERLGPALEPYRSSVFLACKTGQRMAKEASDELHRSLGRLRTDHVDLYQFHSVTTLDDVDRITGPGGALETFVRAREQGLIRYIGFSAHSEEAAVALLDRFEFDSILFPLNWVCWHQGGFGPRIVKKAQEKGTGMLAIKAFAKRRFEENEERKWPKCWYSPVETFEEAALALRFTLSRPITAALTPGQPDLFEWACDAADQFAPLSEDEASLVERRSEGLQPIFPKEDS